MPAPKAAESPLAQLKAHFNRQLHLIVQREVMQGQWQAVRFLKLEAVSSATPTKTANA